MEAARKQGVLVLQAGPNVMRFLPPLIVTQKEMAEGLRRLEKALATVIAA
jgi:acetylornithine/N-succinyldiaminopimelate aminotransferase